MKEMQSGNSKETEVEEKEKKKWTQINKIRNERGEIKTNTKNTQKFVRLLQTVICQQIGQLKRNGHISRNIQLAKTESRRNRQFEQTSY